MLSLELSPGCAGRERDDDLECWVAVATEAYARSLIAEMPLFKEGGQYVPQTEEVLNDIANRIWQAVKDVLTPFAGDARQLAGPSHSFSLSSARCRPVRAVRITGCHQEGFGRRFMRC